MNEKNQYASLSYIYQKAIRNIRRQLESVREKYAEYSGGAKEIKVAVHRTKREIVPLVWLIAAISLVTLPAFSVGPTVTVYDARGSGSQTDRPTTFGSCFKRSDFPNTPKPLVGGVALGSSDWQTDVKTRWDDSSTKCAIFSINKTIAANGTIAVTFTDNADGNNTGYLDAAGMAGFNGGSWGCKMVVGFNSTSTDFDCATMLADNDPGAHALPGASNWGNDELNDYWLIGPVVTAVLVRDHTSASKWDVGAKWDGTTMNLNSGSKYSGNSTYASIDGWHILYFYPKNSSVLDEAIIENHWIGRWQDQLLDLTYYTGSSPSAQLTQTGSRQVTDAAITALSNVMTSATANFVSGDVGMPISVGPQGISTTICSVTSSTSVKLCQISPQLSTGSGLTLAIGMLHAGQSYPRYFWTGTGAPGDVLIDWNQTYMGTTGVFPPYDTSVTGSPNSSNALNPGVSYNGSSLGDYATFVGGTQTSAQNPVYCDASSSPCRFDDSGQRGGTGGLTPGFSGNNEGAPTQLEPAYYLYNMGVDCGTANGKCAKAWWMLTGTRGAKHSGLATSLVGGAGMWGNWGNVPYAARESAVVNGYFSAAQASINAIPSTSFGTVTGAAIGKPMSRYNRISGAFVGTFGIIGNPSGSVASLGGWNASGCDHDLDYSLEPALLMGDYYHVEMEQMWGSYCQFTISGDQTPNAENGYYSYIATALDGLRQPAWSLQRLTRAALVSPDGTPEHSYYDSIVKSNAVVQAGLMNLTSDSNITPTNHRDCNGWSYNYTTANRWEWGRCTAASMCLNTGSACPTAGVTQALHNLSPGSCTARLVGNQGLSSWSITAATSVSTHTTLTGIGTPSNGDVITIVGATLNWAGLNGNYTVSNVSGSDFDVAFNSTAIVGALTGHASVTEYGFGQITSASTAANSVLTGNLLPNTYPTVEIVGATGTGWTGLNGVKTMTPVLSTTATIGLNSSGFSGSAGGTIYYNSNGVQINLTASFDEPWMRSDYCIAVNEIHYGGLSWFDSIANECNVLYTEMALDNTYNPYLIGTYAIGTKDPTGGQPCNLYGTSGGPYYTTYAQQKAAYISSIGGMTTYNTSGQSPAGPFLNGTACDDHSYQISARAAVQYVGNTTGSCTQGGCLGTDAITLVDAITPYFNNTPTNSTGCGSYDGGIKFALQPPAGTLIADTCAITAPTAAQSISGTFNFTGTNSPGQGSANGMTFTVDGSSIGSQSGSSPYSQSYNTSLLVNGAHTAACTCSDDGGGSGTCPGIAFTVSNAVAAGASSLLPGTNLRPGTILK